MDSVNSVKRGLVLEGGAMRGLFTCGVLDVFMENKIEFDGAAGISAGAVFGCNYKSRQIGRPLRYNMRFANDPRYCSFKSLIKTGNLYGVDFCYDTLPNELDVFDRKAFADNPMKFYIGTTDVLTGKAVYHLCTDGGDNDFKWMQASASMPFVSKVVEVDGYKLLDGGIADSIPLGYMEEQGYQKNVVILTQPMDYRKKKSSVVPLMKLMMRRYPNVVKAMEVRHEMYNSQVEDIIRQEKEGRIFVIRPQESLGIGRTESDPNELKRVYELGRAEAEKKLEAMLEYLNKQI
ncbi:MAG: patatin family protein [Lachnospiraceae bacterium]|nr:patatin family protein [Lachnospiraceae bacterium]